MSHHRQIPSTTSQNSTSCHLRRSNAIRIKSPNFYILPPSLRQSILSTYVSGNSPKNRQLSSHLSSPDTLINAPSLIEQIKQGVQLNPVRQASAREHNRILQLQQQQQETEQTQQETMAELLARALDKRYLVMQLTDDESDLSSIDTQPEQFESL